MVACDFRLVVRDTTSGRIVWEGRLEDPERPASEPAKVYVDRDLTSWTRFEGAS